jgi:predicted nucleic-acid-binding Zn-ribbon protein
MSKNREIKEHFVAKNIKLECTVCKHTLFWTRETLMNTVGMSLLNLDWANKKATNYICNNCGYVHWFLRN